MNKMMGNPAAFYIGDMPVYWYGIIITAAIVIATVYAMLEFKRRKHSPDYILTLFLWVIPLGIVFARVAYVIFHPHDFFPWNSWQDVWECIDIRGGGISILGAIPGGALGVWCCHKTCKEKIPVGDTLDVVASAALLGQGLGRWGNFVNQELYGELITNPKLQWFPMAVQIDSHYVYDEAGNVVEVLHNQWFQATFFYEMVLNLIGFALLCVVVRKSKKRWLTTFCYLTWYCTCRSIMESIRTDAVSVGNVKIGVLGCALAAVVCGIIAFLIWRGFIPTSTPAYLAVTHEPDDLPDDSGAAGDSAVPTTEVCVDTVDTRPDTAADTNLDGPTTKNERNRNN